MSIDATQLRLLVIRPAINAIGLWSANAEELMMLTCATESHLGQYVRQVGVKDNVGAYGIFQQEKPSYDYAWENLILPNTALRAKIRLYCGYECKPPIQRMITDLSLAAIMCRMFYLDVNAPLPLAQSPIELAKYWKKYWNTSAGKGTTEKALTDYQNYCR